MVAHAVIPATCEAEIGEEARLGKIARPYLKSELKTTGEGAWLKW
jgi:hypothetical protein